MIALSSEQKRELIEALAESFTPESLHVRVMDPLRVPSGSRSAARDHRARIAELVDWASQNGKLGELLRTALEANPNSQRLRRLNEATGLVDASSGLADAMRPALDPGGESAWLRGLAEVERQTCLIQQEKGSNAFSTGFLVGPDQVMTYSIAVGSDTLSPLTHVPEGTTVRFDLDASKSNAYRVLPEPVLLLPRGVAVLRLDKPAGRDAVDDPSAGSSARARGWIALRRSEHVNDGIAIVQYVEGHRRTVAVDPHGLLDPEGDRIRYRTSTQLGSLGSPVFDARWNLVGMHLESDGSGINRGLGVDTILAQLAAAGLSWDVASGVRRDVTIGDVVARGTAGVKVWGAVQDVSRPERSVESASRALDEIVRSFAAPRTLSAPADDVWTVDVDDASDPELWAWAEAAAVTAYFDPMRLVPDGTPSDAARATICLESTPARLADGRSEWLLSTEVRVRALERLAQRGALQRMRKANPGDSAELIDEVFGAFIAGVQPTRAELQDVDRLRAMLQARQWLDRTTLTLPPTAMLRSALDRATLLSPFRHLTRGFFAGREGELSRLANYVDGPDVRAGGVPTPPIFIHATGGMGKSALLAHFILAHAERDTTRPELWRPFIYLDFDRPELDARDQVGVLVAIARQLGPQVPATRDQSAAYVQHWSRRRGSDERARSAPNRQAKLAESVKTVDVDGATAELAALLNAAHDASVSPLVLVLDTLEEVQYATPDAVVPLVQRILGLRAGVPALRPVLAGRVPISTPLPLDPMELPQLPTAAAEALLGNHLPPELAAKTTLVSQMVRVVGGNPLSLRLAAAVLAREADGDLDALGEDALWKRVGDTIVQGQLYERIAGHIHEGPVRQLAIPGLVLRYVTAELIEEVLAGACGVTLDADTTAASLFTDLAREVALVRQEGATDRLVVRPELRRTILDNFRRDTESADTRRKIHEEAIRFYSRYDDPESRAEEVYHRLWLGQDTTEIDRRWVNGIEGALRSAVDEFDGEAHAYLANRVGGIDDAQLAETMSPPEWEAYAERRASDLLRLGMPGAALGVLHLRSQRLPTSRLHLIESVALRSTANPDLGAAETAAHAALSAARESGDQSEVRGALEELVQVRRMQGDDAGVLRALQELTKLGEQLGDDVVLLGAVVEELESAPLSGDDSIGEAAIRTFSRLPDESVAQVPELARRVAAQVGGDNPAVVQRVLRLVGIGSPTQEAVAGLGQVLEQWGERDPRVQAFIPAGKTNVTELASATQYLLSNRELDVQTADDLSRWLRGYVTPTSV